MKQIFTVKVPLMWTNSKKRAEVSDFLTEYNLAVNFYIQKIWAGEIFDDFNPSREKFDIKEFMPSDVKPEISQLTARALKAAGCQAISICSAHTEKLRRNKWVISKKMSQKEPTGKLQSKYDRKVHQLKMPNYVGRSAELDSLTSKISFDTSTSFDGFITLKSIWKDKRGHSLHLPFNSNSLVNKYRKLGVLKSGILLRDNSIDIRFEVNVDQKSTGTTLGADQGIKTCITLSDGQITPKNNHGYDLSDIQVILARKKKGSCAFKKTQAHRKNYINWSVKQLNLNGVKELRLEKLLNVGKGQHKSRFMQAFSYSVIKTAVAKHCLLNGVLFKEQNNVYRSQRCSNCGLVHKSSRKGKMFKCKNCGFICDSDLNAAQNHAIDLVDLPFGLRNLKCNRDGFFWMPSGLFDKFGVEFTVRPDPIAGNLLIIEC